MNTKYLKYLIKRDFIICMIILHSKTRKVLALTLFQKILKILSWMTLSCRT